MKYLALLRGVNVGGNNIIKMADLKACFEKLGCTEVTTYIQSGNVIFSSSKSEANLSKLIESALSKTFGYNASIVLIKQRELKRMLDSKPKNFGSEPTIYRYDVMFLKKPLTAKQALKEISCREGVDRTLAGSGVLYFSRLISRISQSRINKIIQSPIYKQITIRNWNTAQKLAQLIEKNSNRRN
jgi:uncharacterized protein (DUF1697 family)